MKEIRVEKVTLNFGAGKDQDRLEKGMKLLQIITGIKPVKTFAKKRIPEWGLRPGLPIGCKLTLRKDGALKLLAKLFDARDNKLEMTNFDGYGNISFGIKEYIDIPGIKYDPDIEIMGFEVAITLERPGFRIKKRKRNRSNIAKSHQITQENAIKFVKEKFNLEVS